ncbi:MAG: MATE family efflux transporter [Siphonobacter aquaeclarae]|jgi:putative MATE family efflux protein|nr:MATE family efflux transporter [Siphonobacter aquaeclarae]
MKKYFDLLIQALKGEENNFTTGSLNRAIFLLAVPMVLEMLMESLFAVADVFFVAKVGIEAVATVGMTESVLTLIYSIAIGLGTAATAMVSRRIGEDDPAAASRTAAQVVLMSLGIAVTVALPGVLFPDSILRLMGGSPELVEHGSTFTRLMFASSPVIILLYTLSGILRGGGNASVAMRSLWIANGVNILLDPLFIFGLSFIPAFGVTGAAIATSTGRLMGVLYQFRALTNGSAAVRLERSYFVPDWAAIRKLIEIASGGTFQFLIASASWIFLTRILSTFGPDVVAGYTIAIRVIVFTILPSWGMANAAATLVGQNLGAELPERAETSVWRASLLNMIFLGSVGLLFFFFSGTIIGWFNDTPAVVQTGVTCLRIICIGYVFFAYGMVISQALNGAGDTRTPTIINLICFWAVEIPLAYLLAHSLRLGPTGVFISVAFSESLLAIIAILVFRRGKWKLVKV